jgi:hypothetical protein
MASPRVPGGRARAGSSSGKHAGGRPPKPEGERLSTQLGVRATPETVARLDRLVLRLQGLATRAGIARAALRLGLEIIEAHPERLLDEGERD